MQNVFICKKKYDSKVPEKNAKMLGSFGFNHHTSRSAPRYQSTEYFKGVVKLPHL